MNSTKQLLVNAVLRNPLDDLPRLVLADNLDEIGDSYAAEFIRLQVAFSANRELDLSRRLSTLIDVERVPAKMLGIGPDWSWSGDCESAVITPRVGPGYTFRRGLVEHVTLTISRFMGPVTCRDCDGNGDYLHPTHYRQPCKTCKGAKTTPGLARDLFERWPITGVRLSDREPLINGDGLQGWRWFSTVDDDGNVDRNCVGSVLWNFVNKELYPNHYPTPEAAHAALSDAAVAYGRGLVGLRASRKHEVTP